MKTPTGKGMMIWRLSQCSGGDPQALAVEAQLQQFSWVAIKMTEAYYRFQSALLAPAIQALRSADVDVWAWGYIYGGATPRYPTNSPEKEAQAAINAIRDLKPSGFLIDAEGWYKRSGSATWARRYMAALRPAVDVPLGFCSYRFPTLHPELPWKEFLPFCDFHAPQVYFADLNYPGEPIESDDQLTRSITELKRLRDLPFIPLGQAYSEWGLEPTVEEIDVFNAKALELKLPGISWWDWQHAQRRPEWWSAIARHDWSATVSEPELTLADKVGRLWLAHPELH